VAMPTPTDDDQQHLLQVVWDLCVTHSKWPTFVQVDRKLDRDFNLDALAVGQRLQPELLYPPLGGWLAPDQELRLTIAGAVACAGTEEDVRYFLEVVRFAAELERSWPGRPIEETDEPVLKAPDVVQRLQFPAAGREALLTRLGLLGLLLEVESWGWQGASAAGSPDWQFWLSRQVRRFRGVKDLDQYWSIRTYQSEQPSRGPQGGKRESMATADRIFISHAWADRKLADLLRDTLVLGGIPRERIFYSSSRATGIASGTDVRAQLRRELQQAGLVIELISTTFLSRPMCLIELGAAWVLEKSTYPIVVPPLTRSKAVAQIGDVHMGQLGSDEEIDDVFNELQDRLRSDVGLSTTATGWNPVARRFKEGLPAVLAALTAAAAPPLATPSAAPPSASSRRPGKLTVDNYAVVPTGFGTEVQGEATNNDEESSNPVDRR
jgi:TIR domain